MFAPPRALLCTFPFPLLFYPSLLTVFTRVVPDARVDSTTSQGGVEDVRSLHEAEPIVEGEKWIATKWWGHPPIRPFRSIHSYHSYDLLELKLNNGVCTRDCFFYNKSDSGW